METLISIVNIAVIVGWFWITRSLYNKLQNPDIADLFALVFLYIMLMLNFLT